MDGTPVIYVVKTQCQPQYEKEFNTWYDEVHIPLLLKFKGLRKVTRYRAINSSKQYPEYIAVYEFPNKQIMDEYINSPERAAALEEMRSTWKKGEWELKGHRYYEVLRT